VLLTVKDSTTSGLIIAFILERFYRNAMQWPIEKGKNDKQWSNKKLYRKLKIEQQDSHLKPGRNSVGDNLSL
jgi:hypothetical protein